MNLNEKCFIYFNFLNKEKLLQMFVTVKLDWNIQFCSLKESLYLNLFNF